MYDLIYNFLNVDLMQCRNENLAYILTDVSMVLLFIVGVSFIVWLFKVFSGALRF